MGHVLIVGAKSDIAKQTAREYAAHGYDLYLAARDSDSLETFANDIKIRTDVKVTLKEIDITDYSAHKDFYSRLDPKPVGIIIAAGYMADQEKCEKDWAEALNTIQVNYTGAVSLLNTAANDMERNKNGFIIGISSVAGDRGRKTNYIYGSSKAGFSAYLSGLRNRLHESGVKVLTVKPGFVETKMTRGMDLPPALTAQPEEVAKDIFKAQQKGKDVLYTKRIWAVIMLIIKHIPESIFKKLSI